jgi:tetratricopeptide (TPR) repeat protein
MHEAASARGEPVLYRAAFLAGCGLLAASVAAGLALTVAGPDRLPGLARLDPGAAAEAFQASGDLSAAARELHMLTVIDPGACGAFDALGDVLTRDGDLEGSLRVELRHVAVHPYRSAAQTRLGLAYQRLSRFAEAYGAFSTAVRLNPGETLAFAALGDIARQQGRLDEAVSAYERALPYSHEPARLHNKLAIAHALAGRRELAASHFDEALKLDPGFAEARTNRGLLEGAGVASLAKAP